MKRCFDPAEPELMDRPQPVTPELEADLENLCKLNRYFGSYRLIRHFLRPWIVPGRCYRVLDLATGFGDVPRMIADWARQRGISIHIDAVEIHPSTIELARRRSADYPEISFVRADARTFRDAQSYDLVCSSLALHHFSDDDAVTLLRQMSALSHDKVLVADLERSVFTWLCVCAITATVFREPMTKYDGRLSVRRAFSYGEFTELADAAGWENFGHRRFFPARQAVWMCVRDEAPVLDLELPAPTLA